MSTYQPLTPQDRARCDRAHAKFKAADKHLRKLRNDPKASEKEISDVAQDRAGHLAYLNANCPGYLDDPEQHIMPVSDSNVENV